jgi:hypothetical protein
MPPFNDPTLAAAAARGVAVLADWWLARFAAPEFDNGGGGHITNTLGAALASGLAASAPAVDEAAASKFRAAVVAAAAKNRYGRLETDYDPWHELREAMDEAGIAHRRAPWKTRSQWSAHGLVVTTAAGYGASQALLHVAPELLALARRKPEAKLPYGVDGKADHNEPIARVLADALQNSDWWASDAMRAAALAHLDNFTRSGQ